MYRTAIYSPVKDEIRLKEWIIYYKKLGIDLFIINDDFSEISPITYFEELNVNNYEIIKIDKPFWDYNTFKPTYKGIYCTTEIFDDHIIPLCKKHNIDYLLVFDSDEFLYLNNFKNIQEMLNHYQPFDELNIHWLIFSDNCLKENKTDSFIKSSNQSGKYINYYTKSITKVNSIITGKNAHNLTIKTHSIIKNMFNEIIPSIENNCSINLNEPISYKKAPMFIAHYVYKDITTYVEKKIIIGDLNFNGIFNKWYDSDPNDNKIIEEKIKLGNYHKEHKNDLIDYIYSLRINDEINIKNIEEKHQVFKENKQYYKGYYSIYKQNFLNNNECTTNNLLIDFLYN